MYFVSAIIGYQYRLQSAGIPILVPHNVHADIFFDFSGIFTIASSITLNRHGDKQETCLTPKPSRTANGNYQPLLCVLTAKSVFPDVVSHWYFPHNAVRCVTTGFFCAFETLDI